MLWRNIFRKMFHEERQEPELEKIDFGQLLLKIDLELGRISVEKEEASKLLKEKISGIISGIQEKMKLLKEVDIDKRKEDEKIKLIVKENFRFYLEHLSRLVENLENAGSKELRDYILEVNNSICSFNKLSRNSFEKATILIGGKLGEIKNDVDNFARHISSIFQENKLIFEKTEIIKQIKSSFLEIEEGEKIKKLIEEHIKDLACKLREIKKEGIKKEEEISEIKASAEYKKSEEEKERIKKELANLEEEARLLKEAIDLKSLAKYFHYDRKKSELIKKYAENFKSAIKEDANLNIVNIVKEAKGIDISKLKQIKAKISYLNDVPVQDADKKILLLEEKRRKISSELLLIKSEIEKESAKNEKFSRKLVQIKEQIKNQAKLLNFDVN